MALTLNRMRSSAPGETVREEEKRTGRGRLAAAIGETETEPEEKEERQSGRDRLTAAIERAETPETPSAVPASPAEPAAQQGRIRPGWSVEDIATAQESNPILRIANNASDRLKQAQRGAEYGTDPEAIRADLEEMDARQTATAAKLESLAEPLQRANVAAQTYGSQVQAYETKLGMLADTIANSEDPEERRQAKQESEALDLYYQKAQRAAERYGAQANELNSQAQQLITQLQEVGAGMEPRIERYNELLSWGDRRAATLERQAEEIRNRQRSLGAGLYQMTPEQQDEYWAMGKQANDLERAAARERGNYAQHLYNTQGAEKANAYLSGAEAGNRAKAEAASFGEKVLNTLGGSGANWFSQYGGSPLILLAEIMGMHDEAEALRANDQFAQEANRMSQNAGKVGNLVISGAGAAGHMMSLAGIGGAAAGALANTGLMQTLTGIAESSPLATSTAARMGARLAAGLAGEFIGNAGNAAISFSSGVSGYTEARENGADFSQAMSVGIQKAAAEYFSNKLFSGMPLENAPGEKGYVTKAVEFLAGKLGKSEALAAFNKTTGGKVLGWIYDKAGEGLEEVVTGLLDPIIDKMTYGKEGDWLPKLDQLADEFIGGVMLSLLMSGGEAALRPTMTRAQITEDLVRQGIPKAEAQKYARMIYKDMKAAERAQKAVQEAVEAQEAGITEAPEAAAPVAAANENTPPVPGGVQENAAETAGAVQEAAVASEQTADKADAREIVAKLQKSIPELKNDKTVAKLQGTEFQKSGEKLTEQVGSFFKRIGNAVQRRGLGSVILDRRGVKSDIAHGVGRAKAATFAAVPSVIQQGRQIDYQQNWKGRGYDTYVFAAPVELAGKPTYVAAVVRSGPDNRFYLHEVIDEDGNLIYKIDAPEAIKTGVTADNGITGTSETSINETIPQPEQAVNKPGIQLKQDGEILAPAPERVNLLANNRTEGTNNGTAAAENTGADVSDRNGRRGPGERTRREAAKLARETKEWRTLSQQDKAAGRQAHADDLQLEAVDARSLGVTSAAAGSTVRVYPRSEWEPDLQRIAARVEKATGQNVTFVLGQIRVDNNGKPLNVRGVNTGRGIIVQADALGVSAEKIATHEAYHSFSQMDPALNGRVLEQIRKEYPENRLRQIAETYLAKMNGIVDLESTDQAVLARALGQVREEICADAYAGINAFAANVDEYTGAARQAVTESRNRQAAEATERTTGPPNADGRLQLKGTPEAQQQESGLRLGGDRQYSVSDSDAEYLAAVEAGDMETAQQMVDKAAKKAGYTRRMWHGAKKGKNFTVFKGWRYFTENKKYAERYTGQNPENLYGVYAKTEHPFDTRTDRQARQDFESAREEYGMGQLGDRGLPDWTDGYDIVDFISENGLDYDAVVLDEGGDLVNGEPVYRGESYVIRDSAQVKSADPVTYDDNGNVIPLSERFNPENPDIRYSAAEDEEFPTDEVQKRIRELETELETITPSAEERNRLSVSKSKTDRAKLRNVDKQRREIMKEIDRLSKLEPQVRQLANKLEKLRDIEYQKDLLEAGGYQAVKENEQTIRQLERQLKRLKTLNTEQEAEEKMTAEEAEPEDEGPESIPESAAEYDRLKKQGKIKESPKRNPPIRPQQESDRNEEREETGEEPIPESAAEYGQLKRQGKVTAPKIRRPVSKSRATIAKADLKKNLLGLYSIPAGSKAELGTMIDALADRFIREGRIDENDRRELLDKLYASGVVTLAADDGVQAVRDLVRNGRIYVSETAKKNWKDDDYRDFRREALAEGIYLVNDETARGWDSWNAELAEAFPGIFDADEYDPRAALERIVQVAREGRGEKLSLAEYAAQMAGVEYATEDDMMDNLERQADYALRTFGEKANLEIYLKDRTGRMIAQERQRMGELRDQAVQKERERGDERVKAAKERGQELLSKERANEIKRRQQEREHRKEVAKQLRERQNMQELQQKTLKQLQWLSQNRNKFPGDMKAEVDKILEDIDIYAASVAEEMHIDPKTGKTWRELRDIYQEAKKNDPNFMPSAELERIVARLDYKKVGDLDIGALNDLFKAAVGLRTELYNRNNVIEDELHSTFAEVYDAVKEEMREAPGSYQTGVRGGIDAFLSDAQLTPMNRFQRMAGWNPNSRWYGMAKMLEKGEREQRRFRTEAARQIAPVLEQYADWARRADGQGKDAIWYEIKVPESWEYHMGDKPVFSDKTVTVYMTPAQKVHMYLESKNLDNLRHMEGGRTFADKELYSKEKRAEAFAQGKTVKLLPETVKNIVSDLTEEEQALANALEAFYNNYSKQEINRVSNILYGYDKAMGGYYAPIYTNNNYTKSEPGIFDLTAEGVGNLKSRVVSANPSLNLSAFDAFEKSVDKTGRFVGLSIPIRNLNTLINWRESGNSTKEILDHKWGEKTTQWVENLMTELQSGKERSSSSIEELTNKVLSRYITAVFGANPPIVIKQFASHPLAATYLKWGNLINGLLHVGQADPELISKYTGELDYRMLGYATPETAQLKDNPGILQRKGPINFLLGGGAITWMDGFTVRTLWSAAEQKVSREQPDLDVGTQEQINAGQSPYYQAVAREFEEAVSRSQPMYDTMHRSNIMRETNPLTRAFTLFKTVPQQEYNMLRQAVGEAAYYKRTGADKETQAEARQKAGRAFAGVLIGNLMIGLVTFLNALWKNKGKKYRDEDGNLATGKVIEELGKQYFKDAAGLAIGGDVAADVLSSILFGDKWYGLEMPGLEQLGSIAEQVVNAGKTVKKLVADSIDILQNGGDWGQYMADHSAEYLKAVDQIVNTLGTYGTGLPLDNVKAYLLGGVQWISPQIKTAYDDILKKADKSGLKGLTGASLETRTMHIFQDRAGDTDASTVETIAGLYAAGYTDAVPAAIDTGYKVNGEERKLSAAEDQLYRQVWRDAVSGTLDRITRDVNFRAADQQTQAKTLKTLYDLASQEAKAAVWPDYTPDAYIQTAKDLERDAGIPLEEWLPIRTVIETFTTERDASGKEIRGKTKKDKVAQYINGMKQYSRNQKDALWAAAGYKNPEDTIWHGGSSGRGKTYSMGGLRLPTPERREPVSSGLKLQSTQAQKPSTGGLKLR